MPSIASSRILDTLAELDVARDARERELEQRVAELKRESAELRELLRQSTELASRHTLAVGFLITHLRDQGLGRDQIVALTCGTLDLGQEAT